MLKKDALTVWDGIETASSAAPTESSFRGKLRQYYLKIGEKEKDLLQVTMQIKEGLDAVKGQRGPEQNATPYVEVERIIKIPTTVQDWDAGNFKRTMLLLCT